MKERLIELSKTKKFRGVLFVLMALIFVIPAIVIANTKPTFSLEPEDDVDLSKLHRGDTFKLDVMLDNDQIFQSMTYVVSYDKNAFEVLKATPFNDPDEDGINRALSNINYNLVDEDDPNIGLIRSAAAVMPTSDHKEDTYTYSGKVGTITFKVKEDAVGGTHKISFRNGENDTNMKKIIEKGDDVTADKTDFIPIDTEDKDTFVEIPLTDISLNVEDEFAMIGGEKKTIEVTPNPEDTTVEKALSFETDKDSVADVSLDGEITAKATGTAHITVHAYGKEKQITVNVTNPIKRLYFDYEDDKVVIKGNEQTKQLEVKAEPDNADDKSVTWESENQGVATVDPDSGEVTSHKPGTAVIKATSTANPKISARITVEVVVPVTSASINPQTLDLNKNESKDVTITYEPGVANTDVEWTVEHDNVISIEEQSKTEGSFTAKVKGIGGGKSKLTGTITNCTDGLNCTFDVDVTVNVPLESIKIQKDGEDVSDINVYPNQEVQLSMVKDPIDATGLEGKEASWSSNSGNVEVTNQGVVKGINPGTTDTVTVNFAEKTASVNVHVLTPISSGSISPVEDINLITNCSTAPDKGKCSEQLSVKFNPEETDEKPVITWGIKDGSPAGIVSVSQDGTITAQKAGDTTVVAKYTTWDGVEHTLEKDVHVKVALEGISFTTDKVTVGRNKSIALPDLILTPTNATVSKGDVRYSYDEQTINVSGGQIKGLKKGNTVITATLDGEEAKLTVVVNVPVDNLTIKDGEDEVSSLVMPRGSSKTLTTEIDPVDADDLNVLWGIVSGQPTDVVTIDRTSGAINAKKKGTTQIYATVGGVTRTVDITVNVPVESFTADTDLEVLRGAKNKKKINYTITPADADDRVVTWTSEDGETATVDQDGYVTGLKEGNTDIKGTLKDGKTVTVHVTVKIIPLDDIEVEVLDEYLKGKATSVSVKPKPANSTEFENVQYESLNPEIFSVDSEGRITGIKEGTGKLKIKVGSIEKEIEITIKEIHAESIDANVPSSKLEAGDSMKIEPYANPSDCTDELHYTFESSDPTIATVDENGLITGIKPGKVTIKITADNGMEITKEITIVEKASTKVKDVSEDKNPNTFVDSPIKYLILSLLSLCGLGIIGYKFKLEK